MYKIFLMGDWCWDAGAFQVADELKNELEATGIRSYVNTNNPSVYKLYEAFGFKEDVKAIFMEK